MEPVADQLRADRGILHRRGDNAGVAVVDAGHGVVEMGQMGGTGTKHGFGLVVVCVGMGHGHGAELLRLFHKLHCAGQLRGDVHDADEAAAGILQSLEALKIRLFQVIGVLGPALFIGEVGAFHLDATKNGKSLRLLIGKPSGVGKGRRQILIGQRHGGGSKGGDAHLRIVSRHGLQPLVVAVGEVRSAVAVAVDIDEAGDHRSALQVDGIRRDLIGQHSAELTVHYLKSTLAKAKIGSENTGVFIEHRLTSQRRAGRLAAATDWPTRRIFSSGRVTVHLAASSGYSSARISLQMRRMVSPPLPDMTRPSSIR